MDPAAQTHDLLRPRIVLVLAILCGLAITAGVLYHNPPGSSWVTPPCMMHKMTGLHCPGCGSTRATYALLHGDVLGAIRKNMFFVIALPFLGWWITASAWRWMLGLPPAPTSQARVNLQVRCAWALVAVIILFSVLRNLPWAPFNWLAPH